MEYCSASDICVASDAAGLTKSEVPTVRDALRELRGGFFVAVVAALGMSEATHILDGVGSIPLGADKSYTLG